MDNFFNINNLSYNKSDGNKDAIDNLVPKKVSIIENIDISKPLNKLDFIDSKIAKDFNINLAYKKDDGKRKSQLIILICEDAKRTHKYFNYLLKHVTASNFHIYTITNKKSGIPFPKMLNEANTATENFGCIFNNDFSDYVFLISDLDHYRNSILNIAQSTDWNNNYTLIISNPCIEIWFYYYYKQIKPDISDDITESQLSQAMKEYNNSVIRGGIKYTKNLAEIDINIAIDNAKTNFELEENGIIPKRFATQMYIVAELLKQFL